MSARLKTAYQSLIIDGNRFYSYHDVPHTTIVKGDGKYLSIAAASILAKTYRDDFMMQIHAEYPQYHWNSNKGYPAKAHRDAIRQFGTTPYHRLLCSLDGTRTIVFCNYRDSVERVAAYLHEQHIVHAVYHGGLEQDQRQRALYRFRNGSVSILVSTDLASRGLDIPDVRHIVHYHLPLGEEASIHRTGRTARWDADGNTYYILGPGEPAPAYLAAGDAPAPVTYTLPDIPRRPAPPEWETLYIGKGKKDKLSKTDIAGFLYKKGHLTNVDVGRIDIQEHYSYVAVRRTRVRQLLALVSGEKIKGMKTIIDRAR